MRTVDLKASRFASSAGTSAGHLRHWLRGHAGDVGFVIGLVGGVALCGAAVGLFS